MIPESKGEYINSIKLSRAMALPCLVSAYSFDPIRFRPWPPSKDSVSFYPSSENFGDKTSAYNCHFKRKRETIAFVETNLSQKYATQSIKNDIYVFFSFFFQSDDYGEKKLWLRKIITNRVIKKIVRSKLTWHDKGLKEATKERKKFTYRKENEDNVTSSTHGTETLTAGPPMSTHCFKSTYQSCLLRHILTKSRGEEGGGREGLRGTPEPGSRSGGL